MNNCVGIDVSKGKSRVAIMRPFGERGRSPFEVRHTATALHQLAEQLKRLDGETRVVMEATGHYHTPVALTLAEAGLQVSVVNPLLLHQYGNNSLRRVKTDKKDAIKLANYGLEYWTALPQYSPEAPDRLLLKTCYRQYQQAVKVQTMCKNSLIALLDMVFPGVNRLFTSPTRANGGETWVDFVEEFWHRQCVTQYLEKRFSARYLRWCQKRDYHFSEAKAREIYELASDCVSVLPMNDSTQQLVKTAVFQLQALSLALAALRKQMQTLAEKLPEYPAVMTMFGVGPVLGPQLMAEIGDVCRFHSKKALVSFAGIEPPPYQSGQADVRSHSISRRGFAALRRTLFLVMSVLLQRAPPDDPVYQFMAKKRAEGKPYKVYMMAAANKFLRIYYASVKASLAPSG